MQPPRPIQIIAALFIAAGLYLAIAAGLMLARPGLVSMSAGAAFLGGFETAGPYMFLLGAALHGTIGTGLWKLWPLARRAALILAAAGAFLAVPAISGAAISARLGALALQGIPFILRVVIIFYLLQPTAREAFQNPV